ncbi:hypothetical protein AB0D83_00760 [Streptomyces decoyicus]|uniref:hypothetical protein n=1 Tax=Streptomyces decoyicus TaxID=249567 RepID=UPI0034017FF1
MALNTTDATASLPKASAPGPKCAAELRMAMNDDAHNITVTEAATTARPSTPLAAPASTNGLILGRERQH